jgi:predicted amino acid racemase
MPITGQIQALVKKFEKDNPKAGKAVLTSGDRSAAEQLEIILQPKRIRNYLNIKKRFLDAFELDKLPSYSDVRKDKKQYDWWIKEIMKQAGKPNGFAHVGGKAQDVSLKNLNEDERKALEGVIKEGGFQILYELVNESKSEYKGVSIKKATVFHVFKK